MTDPHANTSTANVPNLGPKQQRLRFTTGTVAAALAVGAAVALFAFDAPRWTRVGLLVPVWGAALGFLQAREKT